MLVCAGLFLLSSVFSQAGLQIGVGPSLYSGTEFDKENGYGVNAEIGILFADTPVDLFLGVKATYVEGLGSGVANLDTFEGALAARVLVPLGTNWLKGYVEGSLGTANLSVSGEGSDDQNKRNPRRSCPRRSVERLSSPGLPRHHGIPNPPRRRGSQRSGFCARNI